MEFDTVKIFRGINEKMSLDIIYTTLEQIKDNFEKKNYLLEEFIA